MKKLFELLGKYKGSIVSTASLEVWEIKQADASGRIWIDPKTSLGYVWQPDNSRFAETVEEVKEFERWYPLEIGLSEKHKTVDWILKKKVDPSDN